MSFPHSGHTFFSFFRTAFARFILAVGVIFYSFAGHAAAME